jgi:hypothetical protein
MLSLLQISLRMSRGEKVRYPVPFQHFFKNNGEKPAFQKGDFFGHLSVNVQGIGLKKFEQL